MAFVVRAWLAEQIECPPAELIITAADPTSGLFRWPQGRLEGGAVMLVEADGGRRRVAAVWMPAGLAETEIQAEEPVNWE